ncbi:MAG: NADH:flavin oxidoreductase/NADH oxidase [Hyphomicrobiaceae bacterium]|nr:MAG: NADH:flavin oxidoreductase/NADH oxidase [Hyphomicrobiaceae bacterium]
MPHLFDPLTVGPVTLPNRIAVAPMCQYSAEDGSAADWHAQHLMGLALSRAGLVMVEATAVEEIGRISHGCLGLYSDANEAALERVVGMARRVAAPGTAFGIQLAHSGRKGSAERPWEGGRALAGDARPWQTAAPSAIPFAPDWHTPQALDAAGLARVTTAFRQAAGRAVRIGFEAIEVHIAHGYLLHEFMSALSNTRTDAYGGALENRMRFPLEVARAVRGAVPRTIILGARITGSDWVDGGITPDETVQCAAALKAEGFDYACVTSGGLIPSARIPVGPNYQVPFAARVKAETGITTRAVGMIVEPAQAEAIVSSGRADFVALARAFLDDPHWTWHAAERLGARIAYPPQYARVAPAAWPGAAMVRPGLARA